MNKSCKIINLVFVVLLTSSVFSFPIMDGKFFTDASDWGSSYVNGDGIVGPGVGGQAYDVEFLGLATDANKLYFGLQTGHSPVDKIYPPGDFALEVSGNDSLWDFAIDYDITGNDATFYLINMKDAAFVPYSSTTTETSWREVKYTRKPNDHSVSNPFEAIYDVDDIISTFTLEDVFSSNNRDTKGNKNSYVLEGCFDLSLIERIAGDVEDNSLTLHWTMGCGNDYLNVSRGPVPNNEVPEPSSILMLFSGLFGILPLIRMKK
ncbi:MAG: hypothetical protein ACD_79C00196G0002 [uncultured bacterium]|nr:MAG: hypothetical protein ACD_79C00196G0002 [uncultured bacterium]